METCLTQITNYLLAQSSQIAVLVAVIAAATFALRNRSAHVRYLLWLIVLAKCLVPPLLEVPVAVLPERVPVAAAFTIPLPAAVETMPETTGPLEVAPIVAPVVPSRPQLSPRQWIVIGWLAGVLAFACIAAVKAGRTVRWLRRDRRPLPHDVQTGVNDLLSPLGLRRLPRMWLVEGIGQPFVWGALRGDIYLPASFVRVADDEHRRHVLSHEISHVMRFDAAVNLLQTIAQAILWFHPFVWWANKKIRAEREKCCDEMAIARLNAQATDYSRAIIETLVTEYESTRPVPSLAIAGPVKNIEERIKIMLKPGKKFYKHPSVPVLLIVGLIALLAVPTALVLTARAGTAPGFGNPTNLGPSVNSSAHEYDPSISADELELYFNSYRPGSFGEADIWMTTRKTKADPWGNPVNLGLTVNSPAREHAPSISADGLSLYFSSNRPGGYGLQDLWVTTRETKSAPWGEPVNLGPTVNSQAREHAPSISTDGLELYFSGLWEFPESPRPGGSGKADIWVTTRKTKRDPWGTTVNLGPAVNSTTWDESPSISGDGLSLYFYSHRSWGSGKSDIWVTKRKSTSDPWGAPVNLDPTVNSVIRGGDPDISRDGSTLYFASKRPGGLGGSDLWQVSLGENGLKEDIASEEQNRQPTESLHQAAAEGDVAQVKKLLATGAAINAKDSDGNTPLNLAVKAGHRAIVMFLIDKGADVNAPGRWSARPLHEAAWEGHVELVKLLIARGADVNAWQGDYWTPLHSAADQGHKAVSEILIASGADINLNREGGTPLHTAAGQGQLEMAALLIDKGADIGARDSAGGTPLHIACQAGHDHIVKLLLARGADIEAKEGKDGRTPLHLAALRARKDVAETLLAAGADINSRNDRWNSTPLHDATIPGDMGVITMFVDKGADFKIMDIYGKMPLHNAVEFNRPQVVKFFLARGADVNQIRGEGYESTPLHMAAGSGNKDMIELLLANGADINVKIFGQTALHAAIMADEKDMVRFLLAKGFKTSPINVDAFFGELDKVKKLVAEGADINLKDAGDFAPLDCAVFGHHKQTVAFLIDNGADVNARTAVGLFPLIIADIEIAELLVAKGANVNLRHRSGTTVLHSAVNRNDHKGDIELVKLLLSHGADVNAKAYSNCVGWEGWTPFHVACRNGNKAIVEMLISKGADINAKTDKGYTPMSLAEEYGRYTPMSSAEEINGHKQIVELLRRQGAKE